MALDRLWAECNTLHAYVKKQKSEDKHTCSDDADCPDKETLQVLFKPSAPLFKNVKHLQCIIWNSLFFLQRNAITRTVVSYIFKLIFKTFNNLCQHLNKNIICGPPTKNTPYQAVTCKTNTLFTSVVIVTSALRLFCQGIDVSLLFGYLSAM